MALPRPVPTDEAHRTTNFEIFFDLVFVFALTQVVSFMAESLSALSMAQGLVLLMLLWWSWTAYAWLGNHARADHGVIFAGLVVAMFALFAAALIMPAAFSGRSVAVALAYSVVRLVYLGLFLYTAAGDRPLRNQLLINAIPQMIALIPLFAGAALGGGRQTALWALAFAIDFGGGRFSSNFGGWRVPSAGHFSERHGLMLMIALGESLVSIGSGAGPSLSGGLVLVGLGTTVCLWLLYFSWAAPRVAAALAAAGARRARLARDAYTFLHLPMVVGILYLALGTEEVLLSPHEPLTWAAATALGGGVALYLAGRAAFVRVAGPAPVAVGATGAVVAVGLLPVARLGPAFVSLILVFALVLTLTVVERRS